MCCLFKDGTTRNAASFPSYGNAPNGTEASKHDSRHATWHDPTHDATYGRAANGTGEREIAAYITLFRTILCLIAVSLFFFFFLVNFVGLVCSPFWNLLSELCSLSAFKK